MEPSTNFYIASDPFSFGELFFRNSPETIDPTTTEDLSGNLLIESASTSECYQAASPLLKAMLKTIIPAAANGTIPAHLIGTLNDANKIEVALKGEAIFQQIADSIREAEDEVLIQTFIWDSKIPGVQKLNEALQEVAERKQEQESAKPLRVYVLIDERGRAANLAFNGSLSKKWPCTPEALGLFAAAGLVDVYPATFHHNSLEGTHAKTVVVDGKTMIITGANFQASNYGQVPAHDASLLLRGPVAKAARADFVETWNSSKRREDNPSLPLMHETTLPETKSTADERRIPILFVSRKAQRIPDGDSFKNPLVQAFLSGIENAQHKIQIATPNLNAPIIIDALLDFINKRGGTVELLLGKNFNNSREAKPGFGGTNQATVNAFFIRIDKDKLQNLQIKWFSLDGEKPVLANVAGASHLKFMAIDGQVTIFGNANLDKISLEVLHEDNVVIDDIDTTKNITDVVFNQIYQQSVEAKAAEKFKDKALDYLGANGFQEKLAPTNVLKITQVDNEPSGFKTLHLEPPPEWSFKPGQYLEIRSGGHLFNGLLKGPALLAIASGTNDKEIEVTARSSMSIAHKNRALHRSKGQSLEVTGPIGTSFPIDLIKPSTEVLLIGGGSGLTALRSVMHSLPEQNNAQLFYSTKTYNETLYQQEIDQWAKQGHVISLTQEEREGFAHGRVTELLKKREIKPEALAFICGPAGLVKAVVRELLEKGLDRTRIFASLPAGAKEGGPVFRGDHPKLR
jgi:cardiolipin synthase A/B